MKRLLHRMGFILSPTLTFYGVGPYNNPLARRNWRRIEERIVEIQTRRKDDRKDELFEAILREKHRLNRAKLMREEGFEHPMARDCYIAEKGRSIDELEAEYRRTIN